MKRVTIFACAAAGLALAALAWLLANAPDAFASVSADMLSRSAGMVLLGTTMIAAGLTFRAAMRDKPKPAAARTRPQAGEYRRGFGDPTLRAHAPPAQAMPRAVVVSLRRAVAEHGTPPVEPSAPLPMAEIERLQKLLHSRAARLEPPKRTS